jgi:multidrug efflux pump subunit AcrA (membrane-fusion protein)
VLNAAGINGTPQVSMREVVLGVTIDGETEIKSGLKAGESVVVQGQQFLTDGAQVRILGGRS